MSWAVNNVAGSLAGMQNAARVTKRETEKAQKPQAKRRADADAYDHVAEATETEHAEAVRSLKDNTQEEAHEDRREHGGQLDLLVAAGDREQNEHPSARPVVYTPEAAKRPTAAAERSSRGLDLRG